MFKALIEHLKGSKLAQAGVVLVVLGAGVQAIDELGAVDLASVPYVGHYAGAIVASAGVVKIGLRVAIALITGLGALEAKEDAPSA